MLITSEHNLTAEIAYRHERIARDWAAANGRRTSRPVRSRPRWAQLRLPAHRTRTATPA
jgi:hypothetical protein